MTPPHPPNPSHPRNKPQAPPPLDLSAGIPPDVLDAFLDGQLPPEQALAVGRALEAEAASKSTVDLQHGIDRVLREQFRGAGSIQLNLPAAVSPLEAPSTVSTSVQPPRLKFPLAAAKSKPKQSVFRRTLTAVAAMLLVTGGTLWATGVIETGMLGITPDGLIAPGPVYQGKVASGFRPEWKCETDAEFEGVTREAFDQPLLVAKATGVEVAGWGSYYEPVLSTDTRQLLVKADEKPVLVFIDRKEKARYLKAPSGSGLHIHKRVLGKVVMYEMTPSKTPQVLGLFYDPTSGAPPDSGCDKPKK